MVVCCFVVFWSVSFLHLFLVFKSISRFQLPVFSFQFPVPSVQPKTVSETGR